MATNQETRGSADCPILVTDSETDLETSVEASPVKVVPGEMFRYLFFVLSYIKKHC